MREAGAGSGLNKVRIWLYPSWFGLPGSRNYPSSGEIRYPWRVVGGRFDIDNWDDVFWSRLRDMVEQASTLGIVVEISLFSIQELLNYFPDPETAYAFRDRDNLQAFGRPGAKGRFYPQFFLPDYRERGRGIRHYQQRLAEKLVSVVDGDTLLRMLPGRYRYEWYDPRSLGVTLGSGQVDSGESVPAPTGPWDPDMGVVLLFESVGAVPG